MEGTGGEDFTTIKAGGRKTWWEKTGRMTDKRLNGSGSHQFVGM